MKVFAFLIPASITGLMVFSGAAAQTWEGDGIPDPADIGATTLYASNSEELERQYGKALPGDHVVLTGKVYTGAFDFYKDGQPGKPIVIRVENGNLLGAEFTATSAMINGDFNIVWGVHFNPPTGWTLELKGHHCMFLRNKFSKMGIKVRSVHTDIGYNEFDNTTDIGIRLTPFASGARMAHIYRNYFHNIESAGNGHECIMIGQASPGAWADGSSIIEYNLFEDLVHKGEAEIIGIKSINNVVRYNTFRDAPLNGHLSNRFSKDCDITGNWFEDKIGMNIRGMNNRIIGNKITGTGIIKLWGGNYYPDTPPPDPKVSSYCPAAWNCLLAGNTADVIIGFDPDWSGWNIRIAAKDNIVEWNTGNVVFNPELEEGTVIRKELMSVPPLELCDILHERDSTMPLATPAGAASDVVGPFAVINR